MFFRNAFSYYLFGAGAETPVDPAEPISIGYGRFQSLGVVSSGSITSGTLITFNLEDPEAILIVQAITFQQVVDNTGSVYICNTATPDIGDGVEDGILWEVPPPDTSPVTRPTMTVGNPTGPDPINTGEFYIVPTVATEGLRVSVMR